MLHTMLTTYKHRYLYYDNLVYIPLNKAKYYMIVAFEIASTIAEQLAIMIATSCYDHLIYLLFIQKYNITKC